MKLSVVIPVFNEEENLRPLHERLVAAAGTAAADYELIFVDDGSADGSLSIIRELSQHDPHVKYLSFSRNFGHEMASTAGLDRAAGDAVVLIDADLQDPPELIPTLVEAWQRGVHVVYARRRRRSGVSVFNKVASFLFYRVLHGLSEVDIPADTGDFRLMDRRVVAVVKRCRENPRFLRGLVSWAGFRQEPVYYDRDERHGGQTKYSLAKRLRLSWQAICAFSLVPLRLAIWLGGVCTVGSMVLALIVVIQKMFFDVPIPGYTLLACGVFFLAGIQLIVLGILAQYVGHVFRHTQNRPLYIVSAEGGWNAADESDAKR